MELIASLELAIKGMIAAEVQRALNEQLAGMIDNRVDIVMRKLAPPSLESVAIVVKQALELVHTQFDGVLHDKIHLAIAPFATKDWVNEKLGEIWADDIEGRVTRLIDTHEEDEHCENSLNDDVDAALCKILENGNSGLESLIRDVVRDQIRFSVQVE